MRTRGAVDVRQGLRQVLVDARGSIFVEYLIIVGFLGLVVAIGLQEVGPTTLENYSTQRGVLYQHVP